MVALVIRVLLILFGIAVLYTATFSQDCDILAFAAKNPRISQVKNPDGTWRTPKYGDYELEQSVMQLENYTQPFTVPKVISWYSKSKDGKIRARLLRVLAASSDPQAAVVLGNSLKDSSLDVRVAATYALMDYFMLTVVSGGTEGHMIAAQAWWDENRERFRKDQDRHLAAQTDCLP